MGLNREVLLLNAFVN